MTKKNITLPTLSEGSTLIDSHCHLDMDSYSSDLNKIMETATSNKISKIITIGIDVDSSRRAVELASEHPMIKATAGIHPHDAGGATQKDLDALSQLIDQNKNEIVGYGEIGLDYVKDYSPHDIQRQIFADQLALAKEHQLPVIIHDREANEDTLALLKQFAPFPRGGVMHCFSGDIDHAHEVIDLGFHLSIPGIVTFKNAHKLKDVAKHAPLNSILLETDGPFLAPVPYRGKRNMPHYLLFVAEEVARLRDISIDEVANTTTTNCTKLFNM